MGRPYIIPRRVIEGTLENLLRLKFFLSQCEKYFDFIFYIFGRYHCNFFLFIIIVLIFS